MRQKDGHDAVVIGSGFGGAVSAARLAEAGLRVLVLERGPWWGTSAAGNGSSQRFPRGVFGMRRAVRAIHWARGHRGRCILLNRSGLLEVHVFDRMTAITGSGVGGGSLIYGDVQAQPDDAFFDFFPEEITADEMRPYYQRVRDVLRPSPFPVPPRRSSVLKKLAARSGHPFAYLDLAVAWPSDRSNPEQSRATSFLLGSEEGGKRSLDKTYLPLAIRAGVEIRPLCEVVALQRICKEYRVHWFDHAVRKRRISDASLVVIAAGTLGTLRILYNARDRDRSLSLPRGLGRHFSTGGDVAATLFDCPEVEDSVYGPSPSSGVEFEQEGHHSFVIFESGLPFDSLPLPTPVLRRLRKSVGLAAMGRDSSTGVMRFDGSELRTEASRSMDAEYFGRVESALAEVADAYHPRRISLEHGPNARLTTVHPLGGASIAKNPEDGVVDHTGQVFGNPGLYIADGSLYPHAPGWPPTMTIAALAERQADLITRR